ncbi:transglycosylase domain-containing protein [Candidatus Tokpelaia sp.]|uniref:transglycosylase domain-containing protein n=1 Tax=Candidatus Tokpelaia sp. TaxID=2233777 RepID=UPI00123A2012|nr:penicillin-binding protein 1A [Candidatus Tokpelaia sp.]KAA6405917.1 penicillin-binding protein [Candidatus Tokpelaia sp.]
MIKQKRRQKHKKRPILRHPYWAAFIARLNNSLYRLNNYLRDLWENYSIFTEHFHLHGAARWFVSGFSEGLNLGLVGLAAFSFIGLAIFDVTKSNWQSKGNLSVTFLDNKGRFIGQRGVLHSEEVPIEAMPDYLIKAVLATEDRRFFDHWGIDFYGLSRALNHNVQANSTVQGGSTLTQQLAKNLFLNNERTLARKIKEAYLALWLECNMSKKEILQLYLDRAYMGGGTFGIASASQFYFGKDVRTISLAEAAMLAGLFKAPGKYAPHVNLPAARARANIVLSNMVANGFLTEGQVLEARSHPANIITRYKYEDSPDYFLDWAFDEIRKAGDNFPERVLTVRTTLDIDLQKAAEESVQYHLRQYGKSFRASQAAAVILDTDGAVRAIVGGRDYTMSQFNRATQARRQTGSSFKPYVYAVAMENGLTPRTVVTDGPINWGGWQPRNYGRSYAGAVDLTTAFIKSLNTVPVRLTYQYLHRSTKQIVALLKAIGIESPISGYKTMVLGTDGMTVMDQATGFNMFANGGMAGNRHGFTQITSSEGQRIWDWSRDAPPVRRVLSEKAATYMNYMLVQVTQRGTGGRARLPMALVGGKTGTTQNYRDAWFVGFTGNYTAAVWIGNDNFSPMNKMTGGIVPAMIWQRMMLYAHQNIKIKPIPGVSNAITAGAGAGKTNKENSGKSGLTQRLPPAAAEIIRALNRRLQQPPPFGAQAAAAPAVLPQHPSRPL